MTRTQRRLVLGTISLVFIVTGVLKLLGNPLEVAQFTHWGFPLSFMYITGVINILAAIGLLIKRFFKLSAITLLTFLSLAILSILIHHDGLTVLLQPLAIVIVLSFCVFL